MLTSLPHGFPHAGTNDFKKKVLPPLREGELSAISAKLVD